MVEKVIHEGYHLVVKPPKNNGNPECDFRISFSHAEYLLSQEMNDIHRECYRCLKKFHRAHFSTQPESLVTFHLKTILMQTMEETDAEMWTKNNRAECMMKLLLNLMEALRKKHVSHFSVKPYNLFSPDCVESSELLETLIEKVEQIVERPEEFANNLKLIVSVVPDTELQGRTDGSPSYYDLKDIYLDICRELFNLTLSDNGVEGLGDLKRKLVESLREYAEKYEIDDERTFSQLFEIGWNKIDITIWLNNEGLNIERMLERIQGLVELWRKPNEEADGTPDPFDPEALLISGAFSLMTLGVLSV